MRRRHESLTRPRYLLVIPLLVASWSCYSLSLVQEPQVLRPGHVRGAAGVSVQTRQPFPFLVTALRVGLFPRGEARLKLAWDVEHAVSGLEAGLNLQPYDGERFAVFLMPHYRFYPHVEEDDDHPGDESFPEDRRVQAFAMPSLFVIKLPGGHSVFLGPDAHLGTRDRRAFVALGGHLGLALRPRVARDHFTVVPEFGFVHTVSGRAREVDEEGLGQSVLTRGRTMFELGLGFSFGARH